MNSHSIVLSFEHAAIRYIKKYTAMFIVIIFLNLYINFFIRKNMIYF